jgi:hypothetical protein
LGGKLSRFFRTDGGYWKPAKNNYVENVRRKRQQELEKIGEVGTLSEELEDEWLLWRIWLTGLASLRELKEDWTYVELLKGNAVLDMRDAYETALLPEIEG